MNICGTRVITVDGHISTVDVNEKGGNPDVVDGDATQFDVVDVRSPPPEIVWTGVTARGGYKTPPTRNVSAPPAAAAYKVDVEAAVVQRVRALNGERYARLPVDEPLTGQGAVR